MAFVKAGYKPAVIGTAAVKIAVDDNGYIAPEGTTPAGTKTFQVNRVAAENDLTANEAVLSFMLGLVDARYNRLSNTMQVKWTTDEDNLPEEV